MLPKIIYREKGFIVIEKPAGLLVHQAGISNSRFLRLRRTRLGRANSEPNTLVDWLIEHYPEAKGVGDDPENRPGIVHRLDKDTSGVMLVAGSQPLFDYFKNLFQSRRVVKKYLALVFGRVKPERGVIEKPIGLKSGTVKRTIHVKNAKMIKEAVTEYRVKKYLKINNEDFSFLELSPRTGRTHQIRVHLAGIGHPVAGDKIYGPKRDLPGLGRQFLHAESLEFSLPDGRRLRVEAELPDELKKIIDKNL